MTLDERVAYLEGRVEEQTRQTDGFEKRFEALDVRLQTFEARMDRRFEAIDRRFETLDIRLQTFEDRIDRRLEAIDRRFDSTDEKYSRYFVWILTAQVTTLAAVVTAFVAR